MPPAFSWLANTDPMLLHCADTTLDLGVPAIMGVLNVTPDSFSDGGRFTAVDAAVARACDMLDEGAAIIDIGGESTRPGADPVDERREIERVLPVIEALRAQRDCLISIDTSKPGVMQAACAAGARIINDVRALREPGALDAAADTGAGICLMHMQGQPRSMQRAPEYRDVVAEVRDFLDARLQACRAHGIARQRLVIDPGFGFGKTLVHNLTLLRDLAAFGELECPVLIGVSRKSMFRALVGAQTPEARLPASLAAAVLAVERGASLVRTHDVAATRDALAVAHALRQPNDAVQQQR